MTEFERAQCRREYAAAKGQASGNECIWQLGQWAVKYGDAALAAIDLDAVRAEARAAGARDMRERAAALCEQDASIWIETMRGPVTRYKETVLTKTAAAIRALSDEVAG